jgi:SAM-dependent methyltransferase
MLYITEIYNLSVIKLFKMNENNSLKPKIHISNDCRLDLLNAELIKSYSFDNSAKLWKKLSYKGISYNDGDEVELRIASIIDNATDITLMSDELRLYITDWPSLYHLSKTRANILRPFEGDLCGDVLEIGAGCGAITRYLGECGGNVLALEGSLRRAAIARARTRNLNNVTIVTDKFDDFQCNKKFDIVTLIGVLEYANLFSTGENPTLTLLERARSFLKPKGKLIIAIENQLGLKYFAGAPEDHHGVPNYGIEGRYRKDQAQTFGRRQIAGLIKQAGFRSFEFLAPFPDYKLPLSIITKRGFSCNTFDSSTLACQSVLMDPQLPEIMNFSPELVWPAIINNELALDLSNSFLIVTSPAEEEVLVSSSTLAWHYTMSRRKELCKITEFVKIENNQIEVLYKRLDLRASNPFIGDLLQNDLPERSVYEHGKLLSQELIEIVAREGWHVEDVCALLRKWLNFISILSAEQGQSVDISNPSSQLPGNFFDYIPSNIISANNGFLHVIDKEWTFNEKLEVGYLTFRSLYSLCFSIRKFGRPKKKIVENFHDLIIYLMKEIYWSISDDKIKSWMTIETKIQSEICGYPVSLRFMSKMQINNLSSFPTQISNSLTQSLRKRYHSLPLPASVKSLVRFLYYRVYRKII